MIARYARSQAITQATIYRIQFEANAGRYQLKKQEGTEFVQVPGDFGMVYSVPEGGALLLQVDVSAKLADEALECVDFYPSGRTQTSMVRISDRDGYAIEMKCESPTDDFKVTYEGRQ